MREQCNTRGYLTGRNGYTKEYNRGDPDMGEDIVVHHDTHAMKA